MGVGGTHALDIVPRGPRRWHRLAASHVEHPHWKGSELYAIRRGKAGAWLRDHSLSTAPGVMGYRHTEPRYGWHNEKTVRFYTCSPLCAALAETNRHAETVEPTSEMPKRYRCEVCGRTLNSPPLFNVERPTQEDADAYRVWFRERVEWKRERERQWMLPEARAARLAQWTERVSVDLVASDVPLSDTKLGYTSEEVQALTGVVQPPAPREYDLLVDDTGQVVHGVRRLTLTEREHELFMKLVRDAKDSFARKYGEFV